MTQQMETEKEQERSWWKLGKTRAVISTGGFLAVAFFDSTFRPELSHWAYAAAALAGLVPVAYRASIGAMSGTPFSIEMLMTLATLGAVLIGADQEAAVIVFLFAVGESLVAKAVGDGNFTRLRLSVRRRPRL
jgi:Zn2+/Cd2+-exporting ATPase